MDFGFYSILTLILFSTKISQQVNSAQRLNVKVTVGHMANNI